MAKLVTIFGGSGFVGRQVARLMAKEGWRVRVAVRRPDEAEVTAWDARGRQFTTRGSGILARIWQHEYDHLEGVLIIDKMSPMDRLSTRKTLKELRAAATPASGT